MTDEQRKQIRILRSAGRTYSQIARALKISEASVKTYCNRNRITVGDPDMPQTGCKYCGAEIVQPEHRKRKRFCSDACRISWWNRNRAKMKTHGMLEKRCPVCHSAFMTYDAKRKYCSHSCYVRARFGGTQNG